ncbi:MAG: hypothetical protein IPJ69_12825 [Deltaproteobacteria bacterium]|nr:MAG: hypothetical protein IPJ69_12825 [Deltaproteobacteria bacterium]
MDPVKNTSARAPKPHQDTDHSPKNREGAGSSPRRSVDRYTYVPRQTVIDFSAQRCAQPRRPVAPTTTPQSQLATPTGPSSPVHSSFRPRSLIAVSATIIIPNTLVGRDAIQLPRNIPGLDFAGFPFRDLVIALSGRVEGSARIAINLHEDGTIHFQVLGANGELAPIRSTTEISNPTNQAIGPNGQPLQNQSFIDLLSRITTNAEGISGVIRPILGTDRHLQGVDVSVQVTGFEVVEGSSTHSVTRLGPTTIDSSIPTLSVRIPSLGVRFNSVTNNVSLSGRAVAPPPSITPHFNTLGEFFHYPWNTFRSEVNAAPGVVALPPNVVNIIQENVQILSDPMGHGAGDAHLYLSGNQPDGTFQIEGIVQTPAQQAALSERFRHEVLNFVRQYPSAPPRPSNDGEPLRVSRAQRNDGTLFLIDYEAQGLPDAEGHTQTIRRTDSDLAEALAAATGLPSTATTALVRDGQVSLPIVLNRIQQNLSVAGGGELLSRATISALLNSYVEPNADGSIRHHSGSTITRESFRALNVLAALRPDYRTSQVNNHEVRTLIGGLEWLLQPNTTHGLNGQPVSRSRTWYHADDRYHTRIPGTQGVNATTLNVLPLSVDQAAEAFQRGTLADPWIRHVGETRTLPNGSQEIGVSVLGENRRLLRSRRDFGNVVTISSSLQPSQNGEGTGMKAYSQNLRLLPIDATHTLVIEDLDMATATNPLQLQWPTNIHHPLYEVPISTEAVHGESLTNAALATLGFNPRIGSNPSDHVDINVLYKLRTAAYFSEVSHITPNAPVAVDHSRPLTVEPADGYDIRQQILDYLQFVPNSDVGPVLVINNDEIPSAVIANHLALLGIERPVIDAWLTPRDITIPQTPTAGGTATDAGTPHAERKRYIRLQDIYDTAFAVTPLTLSALNDVHRTAPVEHFGPANFSIFRGFVEARANPPASIANVVIGSTERIWRTLAVMRAGASGRNDGITQNISISQAPRNGASVIQSYFLNSASFAHTRPENDPSHVGNAYVSWSIPYSTFGIHTEAEASRVMNAFLEVTRVAEQFPQWTPALYPDARVVPCPTNAPEGSTCVETTIIIGQPVPYTMGHGADFVSFGSSPLSPRTEDFLSRGVSNLFVTAPFYRVDIPGSSRRQGIVENAAEWEASLGSILDPQTHALIPCINFARYGVVDIDGMDDMGATALSLGNSQFPTFVRDIFRRVFTTLGQPARDLPFEMGPAIGLSGQPVN